MLHLKKKGNLSVDIVDKRLVAIYPNPISHILNIDAGENIKSVSVITIDGRLMMNQSEEQINDR